MSEKTSGSLDAKHDATNSTLASSSTPSPDITNTPAEKDERKASSKSSTYYVNFQAASKYVSAVPVSESMWSTTTTTSEDVTNTRARYRLLAGTCFSVGLFATLFVLWISVSSTPDYDRSGVLGVLLNYVLPWVAFFHAMDTILTCSRRTFGTIVATFDTLFVGVNGLLWAFSQSSLFNFDDRTLSVFVLSLSVLVIVLSSDATPSVVREFYMRTYWLACILVIFIGALVFGFGHAYYNSDSHRIRCSLVHFDCTLNVTSREFIGTDNDDDYWEIDSVYSVGAFADFRMAVIVVYMCKYFYNSLTNHQCILMTDSTRKEIADVPIKSSAKEDAERPKIRKSLSRVVNCLDEASKTRVENLSDNALVDLFFPGTGETVLQSPETCVMAYLVCGNVRLAKRFNDFMEKYHGYGQIAMVVSWVLVVFALCELVPFEFAYLSIVAANDPFRVMCKCNVHAIRVILKHFNFWVPFVGTLVMYLSIVMNFEYDPASIVFGFVFVYTVVTNTLLGDGDLTPRSLKEPSSPLLYYIFVSLTCLVVFLNTLGAMPRVTNQAFGFTFWNHEVEMGSISMTLSFALYPVVFIFKFIVSIRRDNYASILVSVPMFKVRVHKRDMARVLSWLGDDQKKRELISTHVNPRSAPLLLGGVGVAAKVAPSQPGK